MKLFYTCPKCQEETEIDVAPMIPAKTWGPPENCHPAEGGEIDPDECPKCGVKWDEETIWTKAEDKLNSQVERFD